MSEQHEHTMTAATEQPQESNPEQPNVAAADPSEQSIRSSDGPSAATTHAAAAEVQPQTQNEHMQATTQEQAAKGTESLAGSEPTPQVLREEAQPHKVQPFEKITLPPEEEKPSPVVVTDELLAQLQGILERGEPITVHVAQRVRGGLRVLYQGVKMFLPASQLYVKKSPTNAELQALVGSELAVHLAEIVKDETGKISFIVTRKKLLRDEFYRSIKVGDVVEGTVTSVLDFGMFVDIGGFEGLVHITRVSHQPPADLRQAFKRGDNVRAQVVDIDPEHDKISLSMKALEPSPWQRAAEQYQPGQRTRGVVRRLMPFGAFVELEPGIEGLVRNGELSWTRRVTAAEVLKEGQEVDVVVLEVKPEQEQINLSVRRTTENPWQQIAAKYPPGFHTTGVVRSVIGAGVLLSIGGELDAFMPRSQMRHVLRGKRIPYSVGDIVAVTVVEVNPAEESVIVAPRVEPEDEIFGPPRDVSTASHQPPSRHMERPSNPSRITLGELLSEEERQRLFGSSQS